MTRHAHLCTPYPSEEVLPIQAGCYTVADPVRPNVQASRRWTIFLADVTAFEGRSQGINCPQNESVQEVIPSCPFFFSTDPKMFNPLLQQHRLNQPTRFCPIPANRRLLVIEQAPRHPTKVFHFDDCQQDNRYSKCKHRRRRTATRDRNAGGGPAARRVYNSHLGCTMHISPTILLGSFDLDSTPTIPQSPCPHEADRAPKMSLRASDCLTSAQGSACAIRMQRMQRGHPCT